MTTERMFRMPRAILAWSAKRLVAASITLGALIGVGVVTAPAANAAIGTMDVTPAATLLLPYFEVDLANESGMQTAVRVSNASATAILINVTLWTDYGVPTYSFPIYQPGYATSDIDLRLLFKGIVPVSASAGQDPMDRITPKGPLSQDINFASCTGILPPTALPAATVTALRNAHTGQSSTLLGGSCGGTAHGDNIARGYITMDTVNSCTALPPNSNMYFTQIITNQNVLTGTSLYVDRALQMAFSEPLVHIEADVLSTLTTAGAYTFYGSKSGFTADDHREPLASISQGRYANGGVFSQGGSLIVWRDPGAVVAPFTCGNTPTGFPLGQNEALAFDEQEHFAPITGNPFPIVAQRVSFGALSPFTFGFFRLNLTRSGGDPVIAGRHQSYVSLWQTQQGSYGSALPMQQINSASNPAGTNFLVVPTP